MKFNIELIVSIAYYDINKPEKVEEKRRIQFIHMDTAKWDPNDLRIVLDGIEDDTLQSEQIKDPAAFSTCAMVVGLYKDGEFIEDLDEYLFNQGIAYRSDK